MSSLPLGMNYIDIQRGLTSSCVAIFIPFTTQELFQTGKEALYYGINALSNNLIMVDRKLLKNPNGLILGTPGCFTGDTQILSSDGTPVSLEILVSSGIEKMLVKTNARAITPSADFYLHTSTEDFHLEILCFS